jgi:hypothetical protein
LFNLLADNDFAHSLLEKLGWRYSTRTDVKKQIPNMTVYIALYAVVFGISIWLLAFHDESPTNWVLYLAMIVSILAGLVKFALHTRKRHQQSA